MGTSKGTFRHGSHRKRCSIHLSHGENKALTINTLSTATTAVAHIGHLEKAVSTQSRQQWYLDLFVKREELMHCIVLILQELHEELMHCIVLILQELYDELMHRNMSFSRQ